VSTIPERQALLLSHQKLAHKFAQRNRYRFARVLDYEDLFSIAMMAIWKATETYETGHGASFTPSLPRFSN
jgi:DNA-directed RNA polymerase specialized sigma subunit